METINRLKRALKYCSNDRIEVVDKRCMEYFSKFFTNRPRKNGIYNFRECSGIIEIGLYLYTQADNPTLFIQYDVYLGRDDIEEEFIIFNDDEAHYEFGQWGNRNSTDSLYRGELEYSDISQEIWEILESIAISEAKKYIEKCISASNNSLKKFTKMKEDFEYFIEDIDI